METRAGGSDGCRQKLANAIKTLLLSAALLLEKSLARLLGTDSERIIDEDLRRLKQIVESEETAISPATKNGSEQRKE